MCRASVLWAVLSPLGLYLDSSPHSLLNSYLLPLRPESLLASLWVPLSILWPQNSLKTASQGSVWTQFNYYFFLSLRSLCPSFPGAWCIEIFHICHLRGDHFRCTRKHWPCHSLLDGSGSPSGVHVFSMLFGDFWNGLKGTVDQAFVYSRLAKMPQLDMIEFFNYCYILSQMCWHIFILSHKGIIPHN